MPRWEPRGPLTDAQRDRVAEHYWLALWGAKRIRRWLPAIDPDECRSLAGEALIYAVLGHDPARGNLSTYFCWQLRAVMSNRRHFRRALGYRQGQPGEPGIRPLGRIDKEQVSRKVERDPHLAEEMHAALAELTEDERELLRLRFVEGWPLDALGFSLGIARSSAGERVRKALAKAREALERRDNL